MKNLLDSIEMKANEITTIIVFSVLGFFIYVLSQKGTMQQRLRGGFLGFFMSLAFAYPIYIAVGADKWWALCILSSVLTICGQFVPELLQIAIQKFGKKWVKEKYGIDTDDHN